MMGPLGYFFMVVLFAAHKCDGNLDDFNDYKTLHPHHVNMTWMKCIPDKQSLSAVSIPGTDQSLKEGGVNPFRNFQAWKLSSQLDAGVRFLDMTLWILTGTLYVENNALYYYEKFAHMLNELQIFLRDKTSEAILLRLTGYADAITLAKEMLSKGTVIDLWKDGNIPTMGEARGKIILIQSPSFDWGLPINAMELTTEDKINQMKENIKKASEHCQNEMMLTDTGAKGQTEIPHTVAEKLNKQLDDHILSLLNSKLQPPCIGIISMDFPGPKLIQQIINLSCHTRTGSNGPDTGEEGVLALNETTVRPVTKPESATKPMTKLMSEPTTESISEPTPKPVSEPIPKPISEPVSEITPKPTPEPVSEPTPMPISEPTPKPISEPTPKPISEHAPDAISEPTPKPISEPMPKPISEPVSEITPKPTPEPVSEPTPMPISEPTPKPISEPAPDAISEPTPKPISEPMPKPISEPVSEITPKPTPEPVSEPTPMPISEPTTKPTTKVVSETTPKKPKFTIIRQTKCRRVYGHKHLPGASPLSSYVVA